MHDRPSSSARDAGNDALPRRLGVWAVWLLVVNGMVGAGIFGLPSGAARLAGGFSPWIFAICALLILPVLLCFASLASRFRSSGGPALYATEAFGPFIGFQAGWLFYVARAIAFSANSVLLVDSIGYFWPVAAQGAWRIGLLAVVCGGLTALNMVGTMKAVRSLAVLTVLKFAVLVGLVLVGIAMHGDAIAPRLQAWPDDPSALGAAIVLVVYAFVGFEQAVVPAGEARDPARDMPRGLLLGLAGVAVLYVLIQMVSLATVPDIATTTTPLLDAAAMLLGPVGAGVLMLGLLASVGGNLLSTTFTTPRLSHALGQDGRLPAWFGRVHPRFLTPANSILFYGVVSFALAVFGSFLWLAASSVVSRLLLYLITCAAVPVLARRDARIASDASAARRFTLPFGAWVPVLGIAACVALMANASLKSAWLTAAFLLAGTLLYGIARRAHGRGAG